MINDEKIVYLSPTDGYFHRLIVGFGNRLLHDGPDYTVKASNGYTRHENDSDLLFEVLDSVINTGNSSVINARVYGGHIVFRRKPFCSSNMVLSDVYKGIDNANMKTWVAGSRRESIA